MSATTKTAKTYHYAIIPSCGCYDSGSIVRAVKCGDDLAKLQRAAKKMTADYRREMSRYGHTSGGYRVIRWGAERSYTLLGHEADRQESV